MTIAKAVAPVQNVSATELGKDFADRFAVLSWGVPNSELENKITVQLALKNALMQDLNAKERIRLTCSEPATMSRASAGKGAVLSGDGTCDIIVETDELTGTFDLQVTYDGSETITVVGGVTQGSGFVHCGQSLDLEFQL